MQPVNQDGVEDASNPPPLALAKGLASEQCMPAFPKEKRRLRKPPVRFSSQDNVVLGKNARLLEATEAEEEEKEQAEVEKMVEMI